MLGEVDILTHFQVPQGTERQRIKDQNQSRDDLWADGLRKCVVN